jgi:hypothetical protein
MKTHPLAASLALVLAAILTWDTASQGAEPNTLTPNESAEGWKLLFDGKSTAGWRGFNKQSFPTRGWEVRDGWLCKIAGVTGGDIITLDQFTDFELRWEWTVAPKGNNGIKYFIIESRGGAIGHEYQMMDDPNDNGKHSTGSFYDVLPPIPDKPMKPAGEINHSKVLVRGNHVEHWLNGVQVIEYELGSPEVLKAVANSKFKTVEGFGTKIKGHILFTDHKDGAAFRNVKIRELKTGS